MTNRAASAQIIVRWSARVLSIASTLVLLLFLFGEPFNVSRITAKEWAGLALFPLGVVVGFAIAWRKEILGGAITLGCVVIFCLLFVGKFGHAWPFFVFAFPGLLFIISGSLARLGRRTAQPSRNQSEASSF